MTKEKLAIKAMTIEGFGRFQEPTRIEFAPVTFLIGPNGAGKSTVGRVLAILRRAFGDTEGPDGGMVPGEEFKVWFEFAEAIAPRGVELGLTIQYQDGRPYIAEHGFCVEGIKRLWFCSSIERDISDSNLGVGHKMVESFAQLGSSAKVRYSGNPVVCKDSIGVLVDYRKQSGEDTTGASTLASKSTALTTINIDVDVVEVFTIALPDLPHLNRWRDIDWERIVSLESNPAYKDIEIITLVTSHNAYSAKYSYSLGMDGIVPMSIISPQLDLPKFLHFLLSTGKPSYRDVSEIFNDSIADRVPEAEWHGMSNPHGLIGYSTSLAEIIGSEGLAKFKLYFESMHEVAKVHAIISDLRNVLQEFVKFYESSSPFKLSTQLQHNWIGDPPNAVTQRVRDSIRGNARNSNSTNPRGELEDEFIRPLASYFSISDLEVDEKHPVYAEIRATLESGKSIALNLAGSGFISLLCTYAYVIHKNSFDTIGKQDGCYPSSGTCTFATSRDLIGKPQHLGVVSIQASYIEEIEATLHPRLQSHIFEILVRQFTTSYWSKMVLDPIDPLDLKDAEEIKAFDSNGQLETFIQETFHPTREGYDLAQTEYQSLYHKQQAASVLPYADFHSRCLIFETHSEYIIRTALKLVAQGELTSDQVAINYIHAPATQPEGESPAYHIPIRSNGTLFRKFGPGFFDEAQRLKLELIELNRVQANQAN